MYLKNRYFIQSNYGENTRANDQGKIQSDWIHKGHSNRRGTWGIQNTVGVKYVNFYGRSRTWYPQRSNENNKWILVEKIRYLWSNCFLSRREWITINRRKVKSKGRNQVHVQWLFKSKEDTDRLIRLKLRNVVRDIRKPLDLTSQSHYQKSHQTHQLGFW